MSRTVTIELMDLFTGQTALSNWEQHWADDQRHPHWTADHALSYLWDEGNWSCDCNRWCEWLRATKGKAEYDSPEEAPGAICGEPRIRARYLHGTEPFDDWPADEAERLEMAKSLQEARRVLAEIWKKEEG